METQKRYRKKPVEVTAVRLTEENAQTVAEWCGGQVKMSDETENATFVGLNIPTLEGAMRGSLGDFVIRGIQGEFYPCKPGIFLDSYEEA